MTDLKGKAALGTGSTSGIGRAIALVGLESARDLVEWATLAGDGHAGILVADLTEIPASRAVALGRGWPWRDGPGSEFDSPLRC
jgi:NAD(P)-dependent dehydrogenase (short-subunit alcohol dehydrogenase family)